jgi:hypothetical protein
MEFTRLLSDAVEKPTSPPARPRHTEWIGVPTELAWPLDTGDIYDRDLPELTGALNLVLDAFGHDRTCTGRRVACSPSHVELLTLGRPRVNS